jgi:hypothetical protein
VQALVQFLVIYLGGLHGGGQVGSALKPLLGGFFVVVGVAVHDVHVEEPLVVEVLDVTDDLLALDVVLILLDEADILLLEAVLLQLL